MLGNIYEQPNGSGNGLRITGRIRTYNLALDFVLEPVQERQSDRSPTHNIKAKSPVHGEYFHAGAAWQAETNGVRRFGLSVELPDVLKEPLELVAFEDKFNAGTFDIVSSKKKETPQQQEAA